MKLNYSKSSIETIRSEIRILAEDLLYSYKEVLDNTMGVYDDEGGVLPLYTTSERLLDNFEKEVKEVLAFYRKKND